MRRVFIPSLQSNNSKASIWANILNNSSAAVMLPNSEQQQKVGTCFPFDTHTGPWGYRFPLPVFRLKSSSLPCHSTNGLSPYTQLSSSSLAANVIAHITGVPCSAAVNPKTVKCASFIALHYCGLAAVSIHNTFPPPFCPSFA
jgi:hypothetical protein